MKKFWKYIAVAAGLAFAAACAPQYPEVSPSLAPQASALDVTIDVDQTTNFVTFTMNNKGLVPVWIFGDQKIDGKANKNYSYTVNGLKLRFRDAGEYAVEVKAYNSGGMTQGSLVKTFTLDNTYRDPFDPSPYIKAVSGGESQAWVWNSSENGHFGCGPVGDPKGWWSCEANGKKGFLYDDVMTFSADGQYTFNPGDGKAYANKGSEYKVEFKTADEDYLFDTVEKTTKYSFESNWNEAGIEEIYLVLESGSELSYVPHKSIVEEPRYQLMETKTSSIKKKLQLMATVFTPDNQDGISWYYEFIPEGSAPGSEDPLYGKESKTWVLDNETQGYMGCGPDVTNPTGWWSAAPHDKDAYGVKDDELTFFKDGKYIFDPGADGVVYVNKDSGYHAEIYTGDGNDYDAPAEKQESTYTLGSDGNGDYIEFPAGILYSYVPNAAVINDEPNRLTVTELTENRLVLVANFDGISWQLIFRPKNGVQPSGDPLYGITSKIWIPANDKAGYMGCGPDLGNPAGWWSAAPHDKDAYGVTDDELTFFADGKYVFNPGVDGLVYVNKDSGYHAEIYTGDGNDYDAPAQQQETTYVLDEDENGEYIEFPAGTLFGYVPNAAVINDEPNRLYIKELTADSMTLVGVYEGIAWQFMYKPKDGQGGGGEPASLEEALVGSWTWDADVNGHFGCGPDLGSPTGWWSGEAHCKDNAFMYNDVITFTADGKYTLDPVDGKSYINKDVTVYNDKKTGECPYGDDFVIAIDPVNVNYTLDEVDDYEVIKLDDGGMFSYTPNNDFADEPWLYVKSYSKDQLILMSYTATGNGGGSIAWQFILKRVQ